MPGASPGAREGSAGRSHPADAENARAIAAPEGLTLDHHRDLAGRERRTIARQVLVALVAAILVLGLFNVFGQRVAVSGGESSAARLGVSAPTKLRGGLFFQARFRVVAVDELKSATLVLDPDWVEDITLNTVEPSPVSEASRDGRIAIELGRIDRGADRGRLLRELQDPVSATGARR